MACNRQWLWAVACDNLFCESSFAAQRTLVVERTKPFCLTPHAPDLTTHPFIPESGHGHDIEATPDYRS
jgi:hypothetical protein